MGEKLGKGQCPSRAEGQEGLSNLQLPSRAAGTMVSPSAGKQDPGCPVVSHQVLWGLGLHLTSAPVQAWASSLDLNGVSKLTHTCPLPGHGPAGGLVTSFSAPVIDGADSGCFCETCKLGRFARWEIGRKVKRKITPRDAKCGLNLNFSILKSYGCSAVPARVKVSCSMVLHTGSSSVDREAELLT